MTEELKHTPGPWLAKMEIRGLPPYEFYYIVPAVAPFGMIARVHVYSPDNQPFACGKGNATLIAAAPELLEACKALIAGVAECKVNGKMHEAIKRADAIIAKAEGRTA